jgi:hypothetical protein
MFITIGIKIELFLSKDYGVLWPQNHFVYLNFLNEFKIECLRVFKLKLPNTYINHLTQLAMIITYLFFHWYLMSFLVPMTMNAPPLTLKTEPNP